MGLDHMYKKGGNEKRRLATFWQGLGKEKEKKKTDP